VFSGSSNPGQVVHTRVPLRPSSIIWYRPKGGHALRLRREPHILYSHRWAVSASTGRNASQLSCGIPWNWLRPFRGPQFYAFCWRSCLSHREMGLWEDRRKGPVSHSQHGLTAFNERWAPWHFSNAVITTTIRLRFDGRSTAYQKALQAQWRNKL